MNHASFFSGVGGLDLGLERAGWRTVSVSEIDPYACAVLALRFPGAVQLGSIVDLADRGRDGQPAERAGLLAAGNGTDAEVAAEPVGRARRAADADWHDALLWTGGFPCQDLSVAGKRRGLHHDGERTRSGLAFAFLDLVERYAGPTHAILLENVPGLLSSNAGRDLGALLGALGELGYGWAYRVLDASLFGVPQRRRRVFICALRRGGHPDPDGAAEVLAVGSRCDRDHQAEREAWARAAGGTAGRARGLGSNAVDAIDAGYVRSLSTSQQRIDSETESIIIVRPSPDPDRVRAADGLAGRLDDRPRLEAWTKSKRAASVDDDETWTAGAVTPTLNGFDVGDVRAVTLVAATLNSGGNDGGFRTEPGEHLTIGQADGPADPLLPPGLDSHRYRCCGNGVVAPVAEWIGHRLMAWARQEAAA